MLHVDGRKQGYSLMSLNRFEAFSDGVFAYLLFAFAATLLVIEIKVPNLSQATPSEAATQLLHILPHFLSYATSFIVIGVIWLNHHALFHFLKRVARAALVIKFIVVDVRSIYPVFYSTDWKLRSAFNCGDVLWTISLTHCACLQRPLALRSSQVYIK